MNLLAQLAEAVGFEAAEGEELALADVLAAVAEAPASRDVHNLLVSLHTEQRGGTPSAQLADDLDAIAATATSVAADVAAADRVAQAADLEPLPEAPDTAEGAEEPAAESASPQASSEPTGDATPPAPPAGSAQPVDDTEAPAPVVAFRGQPGDQRPIESAQLADVMAAALASRNTEQFQIAMEQRTGTAGTPGVSAFAAAVCGDGQQFGYCGFPAISNELTVCGTSEWPEAAAFKSLDVDRLPGQPVLRHNPFVATDAGFVWGSTEREAQLLRDESGDLILDAEGRPQLDPDAPQKDCVPVVCDDSTLISDNMLGQCRVVDATYPADKLAALTETMLNEQVRDTARATLTWLAAVANWQVPDATILDASNQANAAARFVEAVARLVPAVAQPQGVNEIETDLFIPAWFPFVFAPEGYLRPDLSDVWASVLARLESMGVMIRPSLDHFVDTTFNSTNATIATQLTNAGVSTWELTELSAGGTIASPGEYSEFPSTVPFLLAERNSITVDVDPFIRINMAGEMNPVGQPDLKGNRRTLFTEQSAYRDHDSCSPLVGSWMCLDPQGVTSAAVASQVERCPVEDEG